MQGWVQRARAALAVICVATGGVAQAVTIAGVSPQGEVAQVRQLTVKFSEAVVSFGDLRLPDPMSVACEGATHAGSGRWANDRVWLYDFREALPPGQRCTLKARADWKPITGMLSGTSIFTFSTGGPAVVKIQPWEGSTIEEDQHFIATLNGVALEASVSRSAWCEVEGLGERLPVRVVSGAPRDALLKARKLEKVAARTLVLACQRPLPNETSMRLVWGPGIAAAANPKVLTRTPQHFDFDVRKRFSAEFSCERENANAPCLPVRPMRLSFSEPIARALAAQVRLKPASGAALAPQMDPDDKGAELQALRFPTPLPENTRFTIELPAGIVDAAGRALANASSFPLSVATGSAPPIAKFAAAPFGVIELAADAMLPVTLRHVQGDLRPAASGGQVRIKRLDTDADMLAWLGKLSRHHETELSARELGLPMKDWDIVETVTDARGRAVQQRRERYVATREVSLLAREADARRLDLPQLQGGDPRPFEVVGIPLAEPGYHVVEIASARLGESLLESRQPMYVRTGVLVTNLGVHFKRGRENSAVWVTSLDRGRPVAEADVAVNDCRGQRLWAGRTDAQGLARVPLALDAREDRCVAERGLFVTARKAGAKGVVDTAFVFSSWHQGIEPWRFKLPLSSGVEPDLRAHTVFDRTLLKAGETVSMKHFLRVETSAGLAMPAQDAMPTEVKIVHTGSGQETRLPLAWSAAARHALTSWTIPPAARLGEYEVSLERPASERWRGRSAASGNFRVEAFRVPLVNARVSGPKSVPIAPSEVPIDVQMDYASGGGMANAALRASALLKPRSVSFAGYEDFSFQPPRDPANAADATERDDAEAPAGDTRLVADQQALATDRHGAARWLLKDLPTLQRPSELLAELSFKDPNGEVQTVATTLPLWPSAVVLGIRAQSWVRNRGSVKFSVIVLDTAGRPLEGRKLEVHARLAQVISTRKRLVGGFYAYDNRSEVKDLGAVCRGSSDAQGRLACETSLDQAGQIDLIARAADDSGRAVQAATSVWVTRQGEFWFEQDNDDRIDLLPEKRAYEAGETARLQVRMPYREATALVAVEREGLIDTRVLTLRGDDPTIELKIDKGWGPNVYVSALVLRGRLRDVPWYSFFTWGWREPLSWARSFWYEGREYRAPTAMVDLAKPSFKLGVAMLKVGVAANTLKVEVTADQAQYAVRQKAQARIRVTQGGRPLAGAEVAFAAVDEGLLALRDNGSWDLLDGLIRARGWGVETSTAQGEIVGRRHYGRKAVAAGGGGGRGGTRELFDTLLLWRPVVALDAQGEAVVEVPLNDSLTSFRFVAVADAGVDRFGSGHAVIRVTQDLQWLSGLPPLVREGDRFSAMLTLRNTTAREMKLRATLGGVASGAATGTKIVLELAPQDLSLAAGAATELSWPVEVPADVSAIAWTASVEEQGGRNPAKDRLALTQKVQPAVPLRVLQATIQQLDAPLRLAVAAPADALPVSGIKRGGLVLALQPKLSGALPGVRRFFETYPFSCLEQLSSKAIGLHDADLWAVVVNTLPTYLDRDGLANYFPVRSDEEPRGSDRLSAQLIAAAHESGFELPDALRTRLLDGLAAFVEGRIERRFWSPRADLDVRKLAAIEALSRHGRATPRQLGSIKLAPNTWPTAALIDWMNILKRVDAIPDRSRRLAEARQILRARLSWGGTTLKFSTEDDDFWWWLMDSADANAAKLVLAVLDDPDFRDELPRLVLGSLQRQKHGAWLTTTANLWGTLALDKFSAKFEAEPVAGRSVAGTGGAPLSFDWAAQPAGGSVQLAWPAGAGTLTATHEGSGKPWLSVQALAAVPLKAPIRAGYTVSRSVEAVERKLAGTWSRGDVMRVRLEVEAQADMSWVVVSDPVPGGATLLGSGLGRDSAIATRDEQREGRARVAYEERSFEAWRGYYEHLPRGRHVIEYSMRLNNPGRFALPPTRVEAMYAPESFGESPNAALDVQP